MNIQSFVPWKPKGEEFRPHPTKVCEPMNLSLAKPRDIACDVSDHPNLSTLQCETIGAILASLNVRNAFLLGDATGVGKGRTIAGLIHEIRHKYPSDDLRIVWISANMRLKTEAFAELQNLGLDDHEKIVHFSTYASMNNNMKSDELMTALRCSCYPLIILDECHSLRNSHSKSAKNMDKILTNLQTEGTPLKIVYSSATACSSAMHMSYLGRLGLFGTSSAPFENFASLSKSLCANGNEMMELVAIDLCSNGAYLARQLAFEDVSIVHQVVELDDAQKDVYDAATVDINQSESEERPLKSFQKLLSALKVKKTVGIAEIFINKGCSVVISLINTGEAAMKQRSDALFMPRIATIF